MDKFFRWFSVNCRRISGLAWQKMELCDKLFNDKIVLVLWQKSILTDPNHT